MRRKELPRWGRFGGRARRGGTSREKARRLSRAMPVVVIVMSALAATVAAQEEPVLPAGLDGGGPSLPAGLDSPSEPSLPAGLGEGEGPSVEGAAVLGGRAADYGGGSGLSGFFDVRAGLRTRRDEFENSDTLGESRLQLSVQDYTDPFLTRITADFLYDWTFNDHSIDLETGRGWIDLREASAAFPVFEFVDIKVGRQILTWGTGDLVFINDLFPKDWQSFFIGRDVEYLKAPSDALKTSLFLGWADLDVIYTPKFDADRYITGERISYWNSMNGATAGRNAVVRVERPNDWLDDDEWAARLSKNISGYELALYGYDGYWKSPGGFDPSAMRAVFPRLSVYGASVRGQALGGIGGIEAGYYDSRDDASGADPLIDNSEARFLAGYERDLKSIARDLSVALQYYVEWKQDYGAYRRGLGGGARADDEYRHVYTVRLTRLLMNQNLQLSLFAYYSPGDRDAYVRPRASYKMNDHWTADAGANWFIGCDDHTFFGQFEKNSNVYAGLRYGF